MCSKPVPCHASSDIVTPSQICELFLIRKLKRGFPRSLYNALLVVVEKLRACKKNHTADMTDRHKGFVVVESKNEAADDRHLWRKLF